MAKRKHRKVSYNVFNIKYFSNTNNEDRLKYDLLIQKLFEADLKIHVHSDKYVFIRRLQKSPDGSFYYGTFSRVTRIEGDWINTTTKEIVNFDIPKDVFANLKEADFVFVPKCHRLALRRTPIFSLKVILKFLSLGLDHVKDPESQIAVDIEKSEDVIQKIFNAQRVKKLKVSISYTNDDFGDDYLEWMDEILKESRINDLSYEAKPDASGNIDVNSKFVRGTLSLSQNNGNAVARIVNSENRTETVKTIEYPRVDFVKVEAEIADLFNFARTAAQQLIERLRPNG
ncbi:MAG: DUF4747 family protein [Cyclobacteriaceae bacterium]